MSGPMGETRRERGRAPQRPGQSEPNPERRGECSATSGWRARQQTIRSMCEIRPISAWALQSVALAGRPFLLRRS